MDKIELIDRAAAIAAITSFCMADNVCKEFEGESCRGCEYYFCVREISKLPTIDAAPVRRGEWKYFHKQNRAVCMQCSFERNLDDDFGAAVSCPNCGADMRREGVQNG